MGDGILDASVPRRGEMMKPQDEGRAAWIARQKAAVDRDAGCAGSRSAASCDRHRLDHDRLRAGLSGFPLCRAAVAARASEARRLVRGVCAEPRYRRHGAEGPRLIDLRDASAPAEAVIEALDLRPHPRADTIARPGAMRRRMERAAPAPRSCSCCATANAAIGTGWMPPNCGSGRPAHHCCCVLARTSSGGLGRRRMRRAPAAACAATWLAVCAKPGALDAVQLRGRAGIFLRWVRTRAAGLGTALMGFAALNPSYVPSPPSQRPFYVSHRSGHAAMVLVGWVERSETHRAASAPQHLPLIGSAQ